MTLIKGIENGFSRGTSPKAELFEMLPHGRIVMAMIGLEHQQIVRLAIHNPLGNLLNHTKQSLPNSRRRPSRHRNIDQSVFDLPCTARVFKVRKLLNQSVHHAQASSQKSKKASYLRGVSFRSLFCNFMR
jgi:hypothetical protein